MDPVAALWIGIAIAYVVGSISFALIAGYVVRGIDIREEGSGNVGATNVGRILGRPYGFAVYALDFGKGLGCVLLLPLLLEPVPADGAASGPDLPLYFGLAAMIGHMFPFYLRFRGGKGVATGSGAFVALLPWPTAIAAAVWAVVLASTRYMALASMAGAITLPLAYVALEPGRATGAGIERWIAGMAMAVLVIVRHRSNIARLIAGSESRIGGGGGSSEKGERNGQGT
jgi:glycerol-3-phosphate acyltransferase PlsY